MYLCLCASGFTCVCVCLSLVRHIGVLSKGFRLGGLPEWKFHFEVGRCLYRRLVTQWVVKTRPQTRWDANRTMSRTLRESTTSLKSKILGVSDRF